MSRLNVPTYDLQASEFRKISRTMQRFCGIRLRAGKEVMVKARLIKRLYVLGLDSFEDYLRYVDRDVSGQELMTMIDALTTNQTSFFRESQHFDFIKRYVVPEVLQRRHPMRFWSAGCASGEEPYSLAIILRETVPDIDHRDVRILATDISTRILQAARQAVYDGDTLNDIPAHILHKYFTSVGDEPASVFRLRDSVTGMVSLARLNLMQDWPMRGPFDAIFCRNVMLYFDTMSRERLVRRFWRLLRPGGHLFIGHSESLSAAASGFRYVQPAVYVKPDSNSRAGAVHRHD